MYGDVDGMDRSGKVFKPHLLRKMPGQHPKKTVLECIEHNMFILPGATLIAKEAFEAVGGFDERLIGYEDDDLFLRLLSAGYELKFIPNVVTRWRLYGTSTSSTPAMPRSRMVYFQKLAASGMPSEFLTVAARRFFIEICGDLSGAVSANNKDRADRARADLEVLRPFLPSKAYRRYRIASVLAHPVKFVARGLYRSIVRRAIKA